jgi:hypothetical protein
MGCVAIDADPIGSRVRLARMSWAYGDVIVHREIAWGRPWIGIPCWLPSGWEHVEGA